MGSDWAAAATEGEGLARFTEDAVEHVWSGVWSDAVLPLRDKSFATLCALIAMGNVDEVRPHAAGALRNGLLSTDEIRAIGRHLAPYVGYPRARHAVLVIEEVIEGIAGAGSPASGGRGSGTHE